MVLYSFWTGSALGGLWYSDSPTAVHVVTVLSLSLGFFLFSLSVLSMFAVCASAVRHIQSAGTFACLCR